MQPAGVSKSLTRSVGVLTVKLGLHRARARTRGDIPATSSVAPAIVLEPAVRHPAYRPLG